MMLASAEPVLEDGKVRVRAVGVDILIALDISNSMLAKDVYPNRLELAKKKAFELIQKAKQDRIGVIAFAKNSYLVSPISFDKKTVSFLLSKLDTSSITQRGTDIYTMLETVVKTNTSRDKKYLLVLSDGGDESDFSAEIAYANEKNIVVFVLGMGTQLGTSIKEEDGTLIEYEGNVVVSSLNESISELAIQTGGTYVQNVISSRDIEAILSDITDSSESKELKSQEIHRYIALFYYPVILAITLLLVAFSSLGKGVKYNKNLSAFMLFFLLFANSPVVADMFDFKKLEEAKRLYDSKEYNSSAKIYEEYAQKANNGTAYYNAGNAYYRGAQYLKALSAYSFARIEDKNLKAKKLSNMGNAFVKLDTKNTLDRAIKHYEASLRNQEDKHTRENLEAVKKALEAAKRKEEQERKEEKKEEDIEYSEQKTDANDKDADEADDSNNKNKNKKNKKKKPKNGGGSKGKKSDKKANADKEKNSDGSKSADEDKDENSGDGSNSANGDAFKQIKELKDKSKKEVKKGDGNSKSTSKPQGMSDIEEDKWVEKLNSKQNTYLYRLNEERAGNSEKNDKNW